MKEEKNMLNLYLSKLAQGDRSCVSKLTKRLADRLLFLPVLTKSSDRRSGGPTMTLNVYRHAKDDKEVIPVFTSEKIFKSWRLNVSVEIEQVPLLGADLCAALGHDNWISIDEGSEHAVVVDPDVVLKIASEPASDNSDFAEAKPLATPVMNSSLESTSTPEPILAEQPVAQSEPKPIYLAPEQVITMTPDSEPLEGAPPPRPKYQDWD